MALLYQVVFVLSSLVKMMVLGRGQHNRNRCFAGTDNLRRNCTVTRSLSKIGASTALPSLIDLGALQRLEYSTLHQEQGMSLYGSTYIPKEFAIDDGKLLSLDDPRFRPFPRWNIEDNEKYPHVTQRNGLSLMESFLDFVNETIVSYSALVPKLIETTVDNRSLFYEIAHTTDHSTDVLGSSPEILYVLRSTGVYASRNGCDIAVAAHGRPVSNKLVQMHSMLQQTLNILLSSRNGTGTHLKRANQETVPSKWPRLYQILVDENKDVPFLIWYGDYTGCNRGNWRKDQSVILFTMAADVNCQYTFPFPTYCMYKDAQKVSTRESKTTKVTLRPSEQTKKWKEKLPKVVWRGRLTGYMPWNESLRGPRYQLAKLVHSPTTSFTEKERSVFDVRFTDVGSQVNNVTNEPKFNWTTIGFRGNNVDYMSSVVQERTYRAVLDLDGFSWSSRFGKLLCYRLVVVLKVEPHQVDYFHYERDRFNNKPKLEPWKHYIPVKWDLSDLVAKAKYATADENADHIVSIVSNANEWCNKHMDKDSISRDALDIWETYVRTLDTNAPNWEHDWRSNQRKIMDDESLRMTQISEILL